MKAAVKDLRQRLYLKSVETAELRHGDCVPARVSGVSHLTQFASRTSAPLRFAARALSPTKHEQLMARALNRTATGTIVRANADCLIGGGSYSGIPTLVWPEGIDEVASDWLRDLVVSTGAAASSAYEYAKILRPFLRFCRIRGKAWDSVDDVFLVEWREHMSRVNMVDIPRINTSCLLSFCHFWCTTT